MSKNFYFIRHAQSEANQAQIMCGGGVDTPLSFNGRTQASAIKDIFKTHPLTPTPDIVIHSGMIRTRDTASILNETLKLNLHSVPDLKEHCVGAWEGVSWASIAPHYQTLQDPPMGETFKDFGIRIRTSFESIFTQFSCPFIVAHGGVWQALLNSFGKKCDFLPNNADPYFFEYRSDSTDFPWRILHLTTGIYHD